MRVYTVGCFDYLHQGHINFFNQLRKYGEELIVGIHDDQSLETLKNLTPEEHQPIKTRMENLKAYADRIYVIPDIDPTFYLKSIIPPNENSKTACYIRANDMPNFPGRKYIETVIEIYLVPYTKGISSTLIRNRLAEKAENNLKDNYAE